MTCRLPGGAPHTFYRSPKGYSRTLRITGSTLVEDCMKVHFGTKKVQKLGRVALTDALLRNAGIAEGDSVELFFDANTKAIIVERSEDRSAAAVAVPPRKSAKKAGSTS